MAKAVRVSMKMSCETQTLKKRLCKCCTTCISEGGYVCETTFWILTGHIAFCHTAAVLIKLIHIWCDRRVPDILTFHIARELQKSGRFLSEIYPKLGSQWTNLPWFGH